MEPMLAEFAGSSVGLSFAEPTMPAVSTVTGAAVAPGQWTDPEYWVEQVRKPVRFADAAAALEADRVLELGPDGVLAALIGAASPDAVAVAALRRDRDEVTTLLTAVAELFVSGQRVEWRALFDGTGARPVELPTYPFQHQRYWLDPTPPTGDVTTAGLDALGPPAARGRGRTPRLRRAAAHRHPRRRKPALARRPHRPRPHGRAGHRAGRAGPGGRALGSAPRSVEELVLRDPLMLPAGAASGCGCWSPRPTTTAAAR